MTKKIHRVTGIIISLFIVIHLINHILIIQGEESHIEFMRAIRIVYRNTVVETILLSFILVQVITGILLVSKKWKHQESIFDRLQLLSGLYLSYFLIGHTGAVMYCRFILKLDSNLYFGASGLNNNPLLCYFIFHYGLAIVSFFAHVACAHRKKITNYVSLKNANAQAYLIMIVGFMIAVIIIYNMMNIDIPKAYQFPNGEYKSMN